MAETLGVAVLELEVDSSKVNQQLDQVQRTATQKLGAVGVGLTKTLTPVAAGIAVLGKKAFDEWDTAIDGIRANTGKTGKELEDLGGVVKRVSAGSNQSISSIGETVGQLNQRLGVTGKPLEELTRQFSNLQHLGIDASVESVSRAFGDWGVTTKDQSAALDGLFRASQATGPSVDRLSQLIVKFGAPMRQFGFDMDEAAALLGSFEKEGVNTELVMGSLRIAMGKFAKEGIPMREGLDATIKKIQELGPGAEATALAMETFGARAGPDMAAAILEGRFEIDKLLTQLAGSKDTINGAAQDTFDLGDKLQMLKNRVMAAIGPYGELIAVIGGGLTTVGPAVMGLSAVLPVLGKIGGAAGSAAGGLAKLAGLGGGLGKLTGSIGGLASVALGPWGLAAGAGVAALAAAFITLGRRPSEAEKALSALRDLLPQLNEGLHRVAQAARDVSGAQIGTQRATLELQRAQADLARTEEEVRQGKIKGKDAELALRDAKLRVQEATLGLREAQARETEATRASSQAQEDQRQKTLNAQAAVEQLTNSYGRIQDANNRRIGLLQQLGGQEDAIGRIQQKNAGIVEELSGKLRALAQENGGNATQAGRFADAVADLTAELGRVPTQKEINLRLHGADNASAKLREIAGIVQALGNEVGIDVSVRTGGTGAGGLAGGGLITSGRGWPRDDVLIRAARGEAVVNPAQIARLGGRVAFRRAGVPGFNTGGIVDAADGPIDTSPGPAEMEATAPTGLDPEGVAKEVAYGTFWRGTDFFSPIGELKWASWLPGSGTHTMNIGAVPPPTTGLAHVGPAGADAKGHPLAFPWWEQWWRAGRALAFAREYSKRVRHGPSRFLKGWAQEHPLAGKLLGIPTERMGDWEHWPWNAHTPAGAVGPDPKLIPLPRTMDARVARALAYANGIAARGQDYVFGGGHGGWNYGGPFDCSGFVSAILHFGLGVLGFPQSTYGLIPGHNGLLGGPGQFVTGYTRNTGDPHQSHTFISINGQQFESGGQRPEPNGAGHTSRSTAGFTAWHPPGFARGGVVGRDFRRPSVRDVIPILARRGEVVITPEQIAAGRVNAGGHVFNFPMYVGTHRELQEAVVDALTEYEKRNGSYAVR
jgi:hypothetical protein